MLVSLHVTDLLDILLEQSERQPLVELDLLGVPLGLKLAVVGEVGEQRARGRPPPLQPPSPPRSRAPRTRRGRRCR